MAKKNLTFSEFNKMSDAQKRAYFNKNVKPNMVEGGVGGLRSAAAKVASGMKKAAPGAGSGAKKLAAGTAVVGGAITTAMKKSGEEKMYIDRAKKQRAHDAAMKRSKKK